MDTSQTKQWLAFLEDERNSAALYRALAEVEKNPKIAEVYRRLAATEDGHAATWEEKLKAAKAPVPPFKLGTRTRILIALSKRLGVGAVLPAMSSMEKDGASSYRAHGTPAMVAAEQSHARLLKTISQSSSGGLEGSAVAQLEGRHRSAGGNALRAAVLGANDGLVSNFSLVMGVAGAEVAGSTILLTGLAGLLAGAISMALGEWVSVQSSRELYQKQIKTEQEEIEQSPDEEAEELALIYQARGLEDSAAHSLAHGSTAPHVADHQQPRHGLGGVDARRAGHRPRSAGRLGVGGGHHVVLAVRPRRYHPRVSLPVWRGRHDRRRHQFDPQRHRLVRHRLGHHLVHRPLDCIVRHAANALRSGGGGHHVLDRTHYRRECGGLIKKFSDTDNTDYTD
jgi:hypothetical protein